MKTNNPSDVLRMLIGLGALLLFLIVIIGVFRGQGIFALGKEHLQSDATSPAPPYPPPGVTEPVMESPFPTITEAAPPTAFPFPTITPQPTPTRKPGATSTPMPLPTPAKSPKGLIWYTTKDKSTNLFSHFTLEISEEGSAKGPPAPVVLPPGRSTELASRAVAIDPSPDQRFLAMLVPSEPGEKAYVVDLSLMEVREPLSGFASGLFLGWHPNGRQFLFFVDGGGPWLVDAETSEVTMLVLEYLIQGGAISPDGALVAYIASGWPEDSLWLVSSAGSDARYQFDTGPQSRLYPTSWSPDGTKIVYYGSCDAPKPEETPSSPLCLFDIKAGNRIVLKISSFAGGNITWSPDGRHIAVTGYSPNEEPCAIDPGMTPPEQERCLYMGRMIFIEDVNSGEVRELTEGIFPVWSPDGSMIAFLSIGSGTPEVWSIQVRDGDLRQLTSDSQSKGYELEWR